MKGVQKVTGWYSGLPIWAKVLMAIPIILAVVGVAALIFMRGGSSVKEKKKLKDGHEKMVDKLVERTETKAAAIDAEVGKLEGEREKLQEQQQDEEETRRLKHDALDSADSFDAVDDVIFGDGPGGHSSR